MKSLKFAMFFLVLLNIGVVHSANLPSKLKSAAVSYSDGGDAPGFSVAVIQDGKVLLEDGIGMADIENDVPATSETVYRIGSLTKQFTAAAIMKLESEGLLKLDDSVVIYSKYAPETWRGITIRNLLNHTSGIPSYTSMQVFSEKQKLHLSHEQLLDFFKNEKLLFEPNEKMDYSNSGYYLLGIVIERASKKTYEQYLTEAFFKPIGMESTFYCDDRKIIKHRASGYEKGDGQWVNAETISMNLPFAAGALCSTIGDLAKWNVALTSGKAIPVESWRQMVTPGKLNNGTSLTYGFGLGLGNFSGNEQVGHSGGINGFSSRATYLPAHGLQIIVLTNSGSASPDKLTDELTNIVLAELDKNR